jgi:glycosyltransferase involved in cell wall biosynthesis
MKEYNSLSPPFVSIITPSYNSGKFIERAILSVKNQDYPNIEHIIVDGKSTDNTLDIIKKYQNCYNLRWISEKDNGSVEALNKGFAMARGDIVAWLDADNYYNPGVIKKITDLFVQDPELDVVYGNVFIFGDNRRLHTPIFPIDLNAALLKGCSAIPPQPGVFFKRKLFFKVKGFNPTYKIAYDYDFWLKVLKEKPKIQYLPICVGNFLIHKKGLSSNFFGAMKGVKETLKIARKHNQPLSGKLYLFRGYLWIVKDFIINFFYGN